MAETIKGLTITVGADTKQFNKEMRAVDRDISATNRQVNELQKSLALEFNNERFAEAQRLAQKALTDTDTKVQALRGQLKHLEDAGTDKTSANYLKLQTELVQTESKAVSLRKKLEDINNLKVEHLAKQFENLGAGITKAGQALAPFSAAAGATLAGMTAIGLNTVKTADDLMTFATMVNLSAEELQRWQYIAMQTDVSNADLQNGLTKTQAAFGKLAKGELDATSKALMELGFSADQAAQGMNANFDKLIATISAIEDPMLQAAYANEIFGQRMGSKMIPMLQAGGEGLRALSAEFEGFATLTNDQISSLADFDNEMNKIKFSFKTLKDQMGMALLPIMQTLATLMQEKVVPAFKQLTEWFAGLSVKQREMLIGTLAVVTALAPLLLIIGKLTTGIGGVVKTLRVLDNALGAIAAHPIIAVIGIIAALLIYLYTTNEQFRESINGLVATLGEALMPILEALGEAIGQVIQALTPLIDAIAAILIPVIQVLTSVLDPLISAFSGAFVTMIKAAMPMITTIVKLIGSLAQVIKAILVPALEFMGKAYEAVFGKIRSALEGTVNFMEKAINKMIDLINGTIRGINKLGKYIGFTLSELDHVELKVSKGETPIIKEPTANKTPSVTDVLGQTPITGMPNVITNNDYSNKDININVTVENYAENVDVDDMVRQINLKLAEQM